MTPDQTPLMRQYTELKAQAGDALLFFRMGDFYELFGEDAVIASRILEITLTSRDKNKPDPMPMAGVPHHSYHGYLQRLLKAGKKVAIAEQMEDPETVKGPKAIVRREITRTFTPAVQFEQEGSEPSYLAVLLRDEPRRGAPMSWTLALLDPATGDARYSDALALDALTSELGDLPIRHLLTLGGALPEEPGALVSAGALIEDLPQNYLSADQAAETLKAQYALSSLETFVPSPAAVHALGILVRYVLRAQKLERLLHLRLPAPLRKPRSLTLGPRAAQHLDLPDVFDLLNRTRSALGARQYRRWLLEPLQAPTEIRARQDAVRELADHPERLERIAHELSELYDLERLAGRINTRLANPRDTLALGRSLAGLSRLADLLANARSETLRELRKALVECATELGPLSERILRTQREDAPLVSREGGIFTRGTSEELDRLLTLTDDGQSWLVELEARERQATGIPTLKVRYNRVFGYYIEITQAHLKNVPAHYQRKQTTVGAERFFTEELKKFEDEIVTASSRQKAVEQELFEKLLADALAQTPAIMRAARALGELDALGSMARNSLEPGWCFPEIDGSLELDIKAGRHPLVDAASPGRYVPNSLKLSEETHLTLLITGPNMGGKSTVMRQVAVIVILGQMGSPIPASCARWGAVSSVYTRIGAHDAIARGQSTFMVEMSELAHLLHHADERSLIVLDEIGRGTSTFDGMSVAWAALEWICTKIRARTLFATHYHELTQLDQSLPLLANAHMAVESGGRATLRFLYELRQGPANESFGIQVASLAGLPAPLIERAWSVLRALEDKGDQKQLKLDLGLPARPPIDTDQLPLFAPAPVLHPVVRELEATDLDSMTPLGALNLLAKLQESARKQPEASA